MAAILELPRYQETDSCNPSRSEILELPQSQRTDSQGSLKNEVIVYRKYYFPRGNISFMAQPFIGELTIGSGTVKNAIHFCARALEYNYKIFLIDNEDNARLSEGGFVRPLHASEAERIRYALELPRPI